jgi:light-regulated signal transduction histidine kinase (bacteriophytochrome)
MENFAHAGSHDLRAPLIHIGGFVDLLFNHIAPQIDERGRHYLATITTSTYRMGRMIDDVIDFSRLNQVEMHQVPLDLEVLVKELIDDLRPLAEKRRVVWLIGHLPVVEADPSLLRQAIVNLASNALKFTASREEARIHVGARRGEREIIFSIRDNGVGFDMKYREKLFGMFQRLQPAAEFDGNGVGLAHVARIIQRHGGRTWAEGVPGGGATFYFSLPDGNAGLS